MLKCVYVRRFLFSLPLNTIMAMYQKRLLGIILLFFVDEAAAAAGGTSMRHRLIFHVQFSEKAIPTACSHI